MLCIIPCICLIACIHDLAGSRSCQPDDHWEHSPHPHAPDRPASRTDVDSRRFVEIGRLSTRDWEERIQQQGSTENLNAFRTPPPRRRELSLSHATAAAVAGNGEEQQAGQQRRGVRTPEPPPPVEPAAAYVAASRERSPPLPPPPAAANSGGGGSWLSAASVNQLMSEEEDRGAIVQQWVESTSHQVGLQYLFYNVLNLSYNSRSLRALSSLFRLSKWETCSTLLVYESVIQIRIRRKFAPEIYTSLCNQAGRYDNHIPTRFQAPIDCYKIPAMHPYQKSTVWPKRRRYLPNQVLRRMYSTADTLNQSKDRRFCSSSDVFHLTNQKGGGYLDQPMRNLTSPVVFN